MKFTIIYKTLLLALLVIAIILPSNLSEKLQRKRKTKNIKSEVSPPADWLESDRKALEKPKIYDPIPPPPKATPVLDGINNVFKFENTVKYFTENSQI